MAQETTDYLAEKHLCNRLDEACKAKSVQIKADPKTANTLFDQEDWEPTVQDLVCKANHDALRACIEEESPAKIWSHKSLSNTLLSQALKLVVSCFRQEAENMGFSTRFNFERPLEQSSKFVAQQPGDIH